MSFNDRYKKFLREFNIGDPKEFEAFLRQTELDKNDENDELVDRESKYLDVDRAQILPYNEKQWEINENKIAIKETIGTESNRK